MLNDSGRAQVEAAPSVYSFLHFGYFEGLFFPEEIPENSVDLRPNKTHKSCYSFGRLPIKNPSFKRGYR